MTNCWGGLCKSYAKFGWLETTDIIITHDHGHSTVSGELHKRKAARSRRSPSRTA